MQKKIQLPKEQVVEPDDMRQQHDDDDVEGHRAVKNPEPLVPRLPSTGGELTDDVPGPEDRQR